MLSSVPILFIIRNIGLIIFIISKSKGRNKKIVIVVTIDQNYLCNTLLCIGSAI